VESIWCNEFERLKTLVAETGGSITIEKALPVGAVPIKVIAAQPIYISYGEESPSLHQLQRDG